MLLGLEATWDLAAVPTSFPSLVKDTQEGQVRPEADSMTSTLPVYEIGVGCKFTSSSQSQTTKRYIPYHPSRPHMKMWFQDRYQ